MRFVPGEPTEITFDRSAEIQALGWACSDLRAAHPDEDRIATAFDVALRGTYIRHNSREAYNFTLRGDEADIVLSVFKQWVDLGPPVKDGQVTEAARAKSYKTARRIVAQTTKLK